MSTAEMDLQDYLIDSDESAQQVQSETFTVDSIEKAGWCMRKLARLASEDAEDAAVAQREIDRINTWLEARTSPRARSREFFEGLLMDYHNRLLRDDPKAKTVKLPHGVLKSRTVSETFEYDAESLIAWAKSSGRTEFIRTNEEVVKDEVKRAIKSDGEKIPGVTILGASTKFYVEVSAE